MIRRLLFFLCLLLVLSVQSASSQTQDINKRRIGMRLPNLLQFKQLVEKRRIGMRLPNIIYLRSEPDKKAIWEYE
ncbi:hypothetical protein Q1695_015408 [Nippostrongylus brasiliensis]|nr:hypothetical protein Q1695_015408 [Nippostrongylus brasiliensis]